MRYLKSYVSNDLNCLVDTFSCDECGQSVARSRNAERRLWIVDRGKLWERALSRLWQKSSLSLRAVARELKVDPLTVKRHALKLGKQFPRYSARLAPARFDIPHRITIRIFETSTG